MNDFERTFHDAAKRLRLWETWKLKTSTYNLNGEPSSTWERMSKTDQDFNLAWNKLRAIVLDTSFEKLKKILDFAEGL